MPEAFAVALSVFLEELMQAEGLSQVALGGILGYPQAHINKLIHAKIPVGYGTIRRIAKTLDAPELLERCGIIPKAKPSTNTPTVQIKVVGKVRAGELIEIKRVRGIRQETLPASWVNSNSPNRFSIYIVEGDSMAGYGIFDGNYLLVDNDPQDLVTGALTIIEQDDKSTLKIAHLVYERDCVLTGLTLPGQKPVEAIVLSREGLKFRRVTAQFRWFAKK